MHAPYSITSIVLMQVVLVFSGLFASVPAQFWKDLEGFMEVPQKIQVFVAPLCGSLCLTGVEYLVQLKRGAKAEPISAAYWWIKIAVGWIAGLFGGNTNIINASPVNVAFWSGVAGHGTVLLYLANQTKELKKVNNQSDEPDDKPPKTDAT